MSATYLLAHKSPAAPASSSTATSPTSATSSIPRETGHSDAIWCSKWSTLPNGDGIVVTAGADHTIKTWNPLSGATPMRTLRPAASLGIVGLSVDPSAGGAEFLVSSSIDSVLCRWNMDGIQEARKELGPSETWGLALHPKSLHLATSAGNATIRVMSSAVENFGEELTTMSATGTFGTSVEYSPDGRFLAVASDTGHVSLFDASTGSLVSTFPAHSAPIRSTAFTSSLFVTASDDKRINVFDLRALSGGSGAGSGGRKGQVASLGGHDGWVVSVEARNDRLLASGSSDGTIKLWDLSMPGSALSTLRDAVGDVWSLSWAPDQSAAAIEGLAGAGAGIGGGNLVSGGEDAAVRWWRGGG